MYTNLGFFRRDYNKSHSPKGSYELRLPKIQHFSSPNSNNMFNPGSFTYKNYASAPRLNYTNNIFSSNAHQGGSSSTRSFVSSFNTVSKPSNKQVLPKSNYINNSIFEIHQTGYNAQQVGYNNVIGIGFLITKSLALTANSVVPDENVAKRCVAYFVDNLTEPNSFDVELFFYTNIDLNLTVVGFNANPDSKKPRVPIGIREDFHLQPGDMISYHNSGNGHKSVSLVEDEMFIYTAGSYILPGMPLFTVDGKLQGFHHTCTSSYKFNQGTRIDVVVKNLFNVRNATYNPELKSIFNTQAAPLNSSSPRYANSNLLNESSQRSEGRYIYWVEWYNKNLYRYDIEQERWNKVHINNFDSFLSQESTEWSFNWGSRLIYSENSVFIIGGLGQNPQSPKTDVFEFLTEENELIRKKSMNERREGPGSVSTSKFIYALGGKYSYNSCERYSIQENRWDIIAPMNFGRYEPVAVAMNEEKFIYVIGGFPQDTVGKSIEKFDVFANHWDLVNINLAQAVINPGIIPVSNNKFAIFGGKYSKKVTVFEVLDNSRTELRFSEIESFFEAVETVYPMVHYKAEGKVFILKLVEGSAPKILFYSFGNLSNGDMDRGRNGFKLPPLSSRPNELGSY